LTSKDANGGCRSRVKRYGELGRAYSPFFPAGCPFPGGWHSLVSTPVLPHTEQNFLNGFLQSVFRTALAAVLAALVPLIRRAYHRALACFALGFCGAGTLPFPCYTRIIFGLAYFDILVLGHAVDQVRDPGYAVAVDVPAVGWSHIFIDAVDLLLGAQAPKAAHHCL